MPLHRASRRLTALGACLALVAAVGAGCGGEEPLAKADLEKALITADNLGTGWVQEPVSTDTGSTGAATSSGCLAATDDIDALDTVEKVNASFSYTRGGLSVANGVGSYDDADELADLFATTYDKMKDCTNVTSKQQGTTLRVAIETDQVASSGRVDHQLNVKAVGSYTAAGSKQSFNALITLAQIGPNVTTVQTGGTEDATALHKEYVDIAIARLAAVTDGDAPPKTTAPEPVAPSN